MTLTDLFTAITLFGGPMAAFSEARHAHAGFIGFSAACVLGLLVGVLSAWLWWQFFKKLGRRADELQGALLWYVNACYFAAFTLIIVAEDSLTIWITGKILHGLA